jgi:hypothetical protein
MLLAVPNRLSLHGVRGVGVIDSQTTYDVGNSGYLTVTPDYSTQNTPAGTLVTPAGYTPGTQTDTPQGTLVTPSGYVGTVAQATQAALAAAAASAASGAPVSTPAMGTTGGISTTAIVMVGIIGIVLLMANR